MKNPYPNLKRLGIPVRKEPCAHVLCKDLDAGMSLEDRRQFNKLFGIQTCPGVEAGPAVYPWDAEAVLERMNTKRLIGSQLLWD